MEFAPFFCRTPCRFAMCARVPTASSPPRPSTDIQAIFAANLRQWRRAKGYPIKKCAVELGVAKSTWSQWENAKRFPDHRALQDLASYLSKAPCQLISTECRVAMVHST